MTDPTLSNDGKRPAVRVERRYDHPIERVWRAVTSPEGLAEWFPQEVEFELEPGGAARFGEEGEEPTVGRVLEVQVPRRLVFTWDTDQLTFDLSPEGDGTVFVLTHEFDDHGGAASFATGWEQCLVALGAVLDGAEAPAPDTGVARHEQLAELFGLGGPEVTESGTGWRVRFERQLTCSAEAAWDLFFGRDPGTGEQRRAPQVGGEFRPYATPEVLLGVATSVNAPDEFAFDVADDAPGDTVRLRLGPGTGHGARLLLDVSGTDREELRPAIDVWGRGAVEEVAREAARVATA